MDLQMILVLCVVAGAVVYLARGVWRAWKGTGCGGGCGCAKSEKKEPNQELISTDELLSRVRSGGATNGCVKLERDDSRK